MEMGNDGGTGSTVKGGKTVEECQRMIQKSLRIPMVKFLRERVEKAGCGVGENFFKAIRCDRSVGGGYAPGEGVGRYKMDGGVHSASFITSKNPEERAFQGLGFHQLLENFARFRRPAEAPVTGGWPAGVVVCSNHMNIQDEVNQVVIHALIHAYDDCRANIDWKDCAHLACSKIRANHLSGDCHYKREFLRGNLKIRGHEQECVRRRVIKELKPHFSEAAAQDAMEAVWETCYNDTEPFDRAP